MSAASSAAPGSIMQLFETFAKGADMDGRSFNKLAKDCKIICKGGCTSTDIDIIFSQVKDKSARKIKFDQFQKGLAKCAEKNGKSFDELCASVLAAGGPVFTGTKADNVRHYDDKNLYTGVHGKGGPSIVDNNEGLAGLMDRSAADVRGRKLR